MKLVVVRRMVIAWWRGIGAKVDAMVEGSELDMVEGEEEEEEDMVVEGNEKEGEGELVDISSYDEPLLCYYVRRNGFD
jgi:hypothetical protein